MSRASAMGELLRRAAGVHEVVRGCNEARPHSAGQECRQLLSEIVAVYQQLGGRGLPGPWKAPGGPGTWDFKIITDEGEVYVELDEDRHFNRYRLITLDSPVYARLSFDRGAYRAFCAAHEADCLKSGSHGNYWTSASSEQQFGVAAPQGDLHAPGSARWKQRAFYDFVKDLAPLCLGKRLSRVSIWETLGACGEERSVNDWLKRYDKRPATMLQSYPDLPERFLALVRKRTF